MERILRQSAGGQWSRGANPQSPGSRHRAPPVPSGVSLPAKGRRNRARRNPAADRGEDFGIVDGSEALNDERKAEIQDAYRGWLAARGFRARRGQREMIAQVARSFGGAAPRLAMIEAGTGTGKTAAYCLAAIPLAQALDKRVVISTATVALQEQVVFRDLPDLADHAGLDFSFTLAKGRGRYVCPKRLSERVGGDGGRQMNLAEIPLARIPAPDEEKVYAAMSDGFGAGTWNGEFDSWEAGVPEDTWRAVTTDHRGCTGNRCEFFQECPFFRARRTADDADVIVANHDLVLADLALGGGVVLPDPEETIFVIDEAHHFPDRAQRHFTRRARLRGAVQWLEQAGAAAGTCAQRFGRPSEVERLAASMAPELETAAALVAQVGEFARQLEYPGGSDDRAHHRFAFGRVPDVLAEPCGALAAYCDTVAGRLETLHGYLEEVSSGERPWMHAEQAEDWLGPVGQLAARAASDAGLFRDYAGAAGSPDREVAEDMPEEQGEVVSTARWIARLAFEAGEDHELVSAPLDPGRMLAEVLWSRCYGALCTSATLRALGTFDRFRELAGLPDDTQEQFVPSPFDFPRLATFHVPAMGSDPRNPAAHTEELGRLLPDLLAMEPSALALFSSWRQLRQVRDGLPGAVAERCRVQGDRSKQSLLEDHRAAVDGGEPSYLLGLASFAEGIDLPNDYCRHVIIAKLPFSVPEDPVEQAYGEWLESQARNPFMEVAVPDAAVRLVQACGRLIRHEEDRGRITLLDRRIVTARYGRALLESLPPYRLDVAR